MKTLALRARVFIHCFLVFGYPGETLALVVHILHQQLVSVQKNSYVLHTELLQEFFGNIYQHICFAC
jgi:uncharacterized membrane protein